MELRQINEIQSTKGVLGHDLQICCFSPSSLLWGSPGWPRYALAAFLELVRHVSALCPLWPPLQTLIVRHVSAMWLTCVRLRQPSVSVRLSAPCLPWVRDGRVSRLCPPVHHHGSALCPALCPGMCPPCVNHVPTFHSYVRLAFALSPLRSPNFVRQVSALCPPYVRPCLCLESALAAPPNFVRHVSAICRPFVCLVSALRPPWVRLSRVSRLCPPCLGLCPPPCVRLVSTVAAPLYPVTCLPCLLSTMCPLKPWPCLWTLPALCLLWGRVAASSGKILSHHCVTHRVYIACPRVSFLHIFGFAHQTLPSSAPYAWRTVWGLCWYNFLFHSVSHRSSTCALDRYNGL